MSEVFVLLFCVEGGVGWGCLHVLGSCVLLTCLLVHGFVNPICAHIGHVVQQESTSKRCSHPTHPGHGVLIGFSLIHC